MIAYNEEELAQVTLERIERYVDEIIVVIDTRTTDRTKEIVESFNNAKTFLAEWRDSFSELRNYAIEQATGDWILSLDFDEELSAALTKNLRNLIAQNKYDGFYFKRISIARSNTPERFIYLESYPDWQLRLFRSYGRWTNRVHEVVVNLKNVLYTDFHILHKKFERENLDHNKRYNFYRSLSELD